MPEAFLSFFNKLRETVVSNPSKVKPASHDQHTRSYSSLIQLLAVFLPCRRTSLLLLLMLSMFMMLLMSFMLVLNVINGCVVINVVNVTDACKAFA